MDGREDHQHDRTAHVTENRERGISFRSSNIPAGSFMVSARLPGHGKAVIAGRDCITNQQTLFKSSWTNRSSSEFIFTYQLSTRKMDFDTSKQAVSAGNQF